MARPFTIEVPTDYVLRRDACSYGYFLLWPNYWNVREETFTRVLRLDGGPVSLELAQRKETGETTRKRGTPLTAVPSRSMDAKEKQEATEQITRLLRLDESAAVVRTFHRVDPRWKKGGEGRLMRSPSLFEDVIKTVTSCNVQWPSTVMMNRRLCEVVGDRVGDGLITHAFPTPRQLARARVSTLRARCRTGYRDRRIVELARLFDSGEIERRRIGDPAMPDDELWERLLELPGIGPYAAANVMQLMGRYERLPLDSESVRHGKVVLGFTGSDRGVMKRVARHFEPFGAHKFRSYWFELREFYESRKGPAWSWDAFSTGLTFTASQLK